MSDQGIDTERAKRLRKRIAAKGLTLAEFARQAGLTRNVMYGLAKGRVPKPDTCGRIDAILGVDSVDLVEEHTFVTQKPAS